MTNTQTIVAVARWSARAVGALLLPMILAFAVGDRVVNPLHGLSWETVLGIGLWSMILGQIIAWKREGIGGVLILGGFILFVSANHGISLKIVFLPCLATGLLYLACWWHRSKTPSISLDEESRRVGSPRWGVHLLTVLSSLTFLLALVGLSLSLLWASRQNTSNLGGVAVALAMVFAGLLDLCVTSVGCLLATIGLVVEAFARRRFSRLLALLLTLNAAVGPIPLLFVNVVEYCRKNPLLVRAVTSGNTAWTQSLLSTRTIAQKPDWEGYLALKAAVNEGRLDMVDALVTAYATADRDDDLAVTYENALIIASARNRNTEIVRRLLQAGANPNTPPRRSAWSAATLAARKGNRAVLEVLLNAGAQPTLGAGIGTPLDEAVGNVNVELVKLLLSRNADQGFKRNPEFGSNLLGTAAFRQSEELTRILLDAGCDPNGKPQGHEWLPLQTAVCTSHNPSIVRLLLEHGADPNNPRIRFNNERTQPTLLDCAKRDAERSHDWSIVELLKSHGAK